MNVANRVLLRMAIILNANKVNLFVSYVLFVFWYHSPNVLGTHICNISWLRVKDGKPAFRKPPPSQNGWMADIGAVQHVWRRLKEAAFNYLETRTLNQDRLRTYLVLFVCTVMQTITQVWDSS
jgi:hypothetical protein